MASALKAADATASQEYWRGNISGYDALAAERDEVKTQLAAKQAELDSVFAMKPAKRRKLQVAFNLLARCDG